LIQNSHRNRIATQEETDGEVLVDTFIEGIVISSFAFGSKLFAIIDEKVNVFDLVGNFLYSWGDIGPEPGNFMDPSSIAVCNGQVYVADTGNNRIQVFSLFGEFIGEISFPEPYHITAHKGLI
jgi:hypothetical protein